jgi:hypothetical protein
MGPVKIVYLFFVPIISSPTPSRFGAMLHVPRSHAFPEIFLFEAARVRFYPQNSICSDGTLIERTECVTNWNNKPNSREAKSKRVVLCQVPRVEQDPANMASLTIDVFRVPQARKDSGLEIEYARSYRKRQTLNRVRVSFVISISPQSEYGRSVSLASCRKPFLQPRLLAKSDGIHRSLGAAKYVRKSLARFIPSCGFRGGSRESRRSLRSRGERADMQHALSALGVLKLESEESAIGERKRAKRI